jgi:parallel beta-helix repeat protein
MTNFLLENANSPRIVHSRLTCLMLAAGCLTLAACGGGTSTSGTSGTASVASTATRASIASVAATAVVTAGRYHVRGVQSGLCLEVTGAGTADGVNVQQDTCADVPQQWLDVEAVEGGAWRFTFENSGKVLDVSDVSTSNGALVHQWDWVDGANQRWTSRSVGTSVQLISVNSGKCLDVTNFSLVPGGPIQQWDCGNNDNQLWTLDATTTAPAPAPATSISVLSYGAVGNGTTDNQTALQNAFTAAQQQGKSVWIPSGVFNHSGVLNANGIAIQGAGFDAILQATNPDQSAIELQGNAPAISNLKTEVVAPNRSNQPQAAAIWILKATGASVKNVITRGAASNGIRLDGATYATISSNFVLGTNADGIAATNGASYNTIANNLVYQSADDAYSDDSYNGEPQDLGNKFTGNIGYHIPYGRGFAAAGSAQGVFNGNAINGTTWIGIYAQTDTSSNTQVTSNWNLQNNLVLNANTTVASNYTAFNGNPVGGWIISGSGMVVSNNQTTGTMPSFSSVLGWDPSPYMVDRYSFNPTYVPGTGPGASN